YVVRIMLSGLPWPACCKGWARELLIVGCIAVHARKENRFTNLARNIILTMRIKNTFMMKLFF
ncbi:hypothetical protein, partial [Vibrio methylphosphonaticus]|uniref:hypothetical protein n=1 Tax=Vibrio methylphosphonaticus TaxID=2946866 RepID=UPI00202A2C81